MTLKNKVAIVTGGNSGIGQAIVLELARQGANIVIDYVAHPDATVALEREVAALGDQCIGVDADVSQIADLQKLVDAAVAKFKRLDIMVNNAGIETRTSVLDTTEDQYDAVLKINLKSAFFGTQIAAQQMIKQGGGGRIINITSVHEDWPMPGNTAYCLSKGGMRMLTRTAGVELAPHDILLRRRWSGRGGDADQHRHHGRSRQAQEAGRRPSRSDAWRNRARSPAWSPSWPATARAISPPPRSSRTAASCKAAPVSRRHGAPHRRLRSDWRLRDRGARRPRRVDRLVLHATLRLGGLLRRHSRHVRQWTLASRADRSERQDHAPLSARHAHPRDAVRDRHRRPPPWSTSCTRPSPTRTSCGS